MKCWSVVVAIAEGRRGDVCVIGDPGDAGGYGRLSCLANVMITTYNLRFSVSLVSHVVIVRYLFHGSVFPPGRFVSRMLQAICANEK